MRSIRIPGLLLLFTLVLGLPRAEAVIMRLTPLADVLAESNFILLATVETLDAEKLQMVLGVSEALKGKPEFKKLPMLLRGDAEATKGKQVPQLLKRLKTDLPLVLFVNQRDREFVAFGYTNGTWFQATGVQPKDADTPLFTWLHFEPYFRRTFKGTTQELRDTIVEALAGKKKPPEVNPKEEPGLGPEVGEKSGALPAPPLREPVPEPSRGVIVAPWLLGPLALLGMIFPAVFGGLVEGMRRWMIWISVISFNSTLLLLRSEWLIHLDPLAWWNSEAFLWLVTSVVTFLGAAWAFHRQVARVQSPPATGVVRPGRGEIITLSVVFLLGLIPFWIWPQSSLRGMTLLMKTLVLIECGLLTAVLHAAYLHLRGEKSRVFLPGEGVALLVMLFGSIPLQPGANLAQGGESVASAPAGAPKFQKIAWTIKLPSPSWIASSPTVAGDRVYYGAVHGAAFRSGAVYCADLNTGKVLWSFNNERKMKDVFCSPTVAEGCVFIGEGFHQHLGCRLYCLDAMSGAQKWAFETSSHTESTPAIVNGKVYFGAGDDGLYCLETKTGKVVWHLEKLHIDANPLVAGGKVYVGSGKGDLFSDYAIVCLDADTGKEQWRTPMELPAWGGAALAGDMLLVGIGNGNFLESEAKPAGAVLGLDAKTGKRIWQTDMKDGVHVKLATDGTHVWAASRDQHVACLTVAEGKKVWAKDLNSPIVASPALVTGLPGQMVMGIGAAPALPAPVSLIVATSAGAVVCLDPATGERHWAFDVTQNAGTADVQMFSSPCVVVRPALEGKGERRHVLFGCGLNSFDSGILYCLEDERKP